MADDIVKAFEDMLATVKAAPWPERVVVYYPYTGKNVIFDPYAIGKKKHFLRRELKRIERMGQ